MEITSAAGASAFQAARIQQQISTSVLAKTMSIAKQQGEDVVELIEAASEIVEHQPGSKSHQLDITA